eukprot:8197216-Pyramimonas_sp.AAC.1
MTLPVFLIFTPENAAYATPLTQNAMRGQPPATHRPMPGPGPGRGDSFQQLSRSVPVCGKNRGGSLRPPFQQALSASTADKRFWHDAEVSPCFLGMLGQRRRAQGWRGQQRHHASTLQRLCFSSGAGICVQQAAPSTDTRPSPETRGYPSS